MLGSKLVKSAAWLAPLLLAACAGDPVPNDPQGKPADKDPPILQEAGCGAGNPTACTNVVDRVVVAMLTRSGRAVAVEDSETFCRRAAIDLNGITPSAAEIEQRCKGRTPAQIVHYFMNKPSSVHVPDGSAPYIYTSRREWAQIFRYQVIDNNVSTTFYADVQRLDALVSDLYAEKLGYDRFAIEAMASQAFVRRFGLVNAASKDYSLIAEAAYRIFLGREALPSDAADFGSLWRPFDLMTMDRNTSLTRYKDCVTCTHQEVTINPANCRGTSALLCQSTVFGAAQPAITVTAATYVTDLDAANKEAIRLPGKLLVERANRQFAEAAIDRAMIRYLGWWNSGLYMPDFNLPAVRDALVDFFIKSGYNLRALEREIVTSVLYTQPQRLRQGDIDEAPLWTAGPVKQMSAEAYLDSLAASTSVNLGGCDFRYAASYNANGQATTPPRSIWTFPVTPGVVVSYPVMARKLSGCAGGAEKGDPTGLVPALALREILGTLCSHSLVLTALTPTVTLETDPTEALSRIFVRQYEAALSRKPQASEVSAFVDIARSEGCPEGNCDPKVVSTQLCQALFASSMVAFY